MFLLREKVAYEGYKTHLAYKAEPHQPGVELPSEAADVGLNVARRAGEWA